MGNAPDLDWGKVFKAVWRYVLLLVGAWLALRYCSYHDSVMGMFFVACVVVIICTAMIIRRLNRLQKTMEEKKQPHSVYFLTGFVAIVYQNCKIGLSFSKRIWYNQNIPNVRSTTLCRKR